MMLAFRCGTIELLLEERYAELSLKAAMTTVRVSCSSKLEKFDAGLGKMTSVRAYRATTLPECIQVSICLARLL